MASTEQGSHGDVRTMRTSLGLMQKLLVGVFVIVVGAAVAIAMVVPSITIHGYVMAAFSWPILLHLSVHLAIVGAMLYQFWLAWKESSLWRMVFFGVVAVQFIVWDFLYPLWKFSFN